MTIEAEPWSELRLIAPGYTNAISNAIQMKAFAYIYNRLPESLRDSKWHLKFSSSNDSRFDFFRIPISPTRGKELAYQLGTVNFHVAVSGIECRPWNPSEAYRQSCKDFTDEMVMEDLSIAHTWSKGWAQFMAKEGVMEETLTSLHDSISSFLQGGDRLIFISTLKSAKFPDPENFVTDVQSLMESAACFRVPPTKVQQSRSHLRANTVFLPGFPAPDCS